MQVKSHSSHQNSSQTQRCKSIFISNMSPKVLTWWQWKRKINFFKIFNTADILIFWKMIIQNKISLIWSICKCSHFAYKMYWHSTNLFPNINSEEQVFQNFRKPFFFLKWHTGGKEHQNKQWALLFSILLSPSAYRHMSFIILIKIGMIFTPSSTKMSWGREG